MGGIAERVPGIGASRSPLAAIPGSDALSELVHLIRTPTQFFHERFEQYGRIFKTRLVYQVVFLIGHEANRSIMITKRHQFGFGAGYAQTPVERIFHNSIMLQDGEDHRRTRDILTPAVGRLAVRESAEQVHRVWGPHGASLAGGTRDAYDVAQRGTFAVAAGALTGLETDGDAEAFRPDFEALIEGIMAPTKVRVPFGKLDRALKARDRIIAKMRPRVEAARAAEPVGLLGQLAHYTDEDGVHLPIDEIIEHLILLFWAGYDTTASSVSWVLHVLARRPDWQRRLRDDLAKVDDIASMENRSDLQQVAWFLYEIERMYPSVLFFPRIAMEDIEYAGYSIPKGTPTFYSPYMTHHDPGSFENPDVFDPERWDPELGDKQAKRSYLVGFGGGPRICLGKAFANLQLRIVLHAILGRYRLSPDLSRPYSVMGLPVHHPVDSGIRFDPL